MHHKHALPACGCKAAWGVVQTYGSNTMALVVQGEEEGPADILDEELQKQLNEIADYDSDDATQPTAAAGQLHQHHAAIFVPTEAFLLVQACLAWIAGIASAVRLHDAPQETATLGIFTQHDVKLHCPGGVMHVHHCP